MSRVQNSNSAVPEISEFSYLSIAEAAALLGVNRSAIYQAVRAGRLATVILMGKKAIRREDVLAYTPKPYSRRDVQGKVSP